MCFLLDIKVTNKITHSGEIEFSVPQDSFDDTESISDNTSNSDNSISSILSNDSIKSNEIYKELSSIVSDSNANNSDSNDNSKKLVLEAPDFDNYVTHRLPGDCGCNSDESCKSYQSNESIFYIPTSDAGVLPVEIEKQDDVLQTRGMNISGHVILNFVGTLLTLKTISA